MERAEKDEHKEDVEHLNQKINGLTQENLLLRNDNACLKSILEHDSSNTSLPPSSVQKGSRPVNTYNRRKKTGRKSGGKKDHKGTTLTKAEAEETIKSGNCCHVIKEIGTPSLKGYLTKYVIVLDVAPLITELHIYADEAGRFHVPLEYRSDVTYGPNAKKEEQTLLNRVEKYRQNHLMFLNDFGVPFDNNMSERDLRKAKNRQKMAGGFRKASGNEMYCSILSIIETLKRREMAILENIKCLFMGTPAIF